MREVRVTPDKPFRVVYGDERFSVSNMLIRLEGK